MSESKSFETELPRIFMPKLVANAYDGFYSRTRFASSSRTHFGSSSFQVMVLVLLQVLVLLFLLLQVVVLVLLLFHVVYVKDQTKKK